MPSFAGTSSYLSRIHHHNHRGTKSRKKYRGQQIFSKANSGGGARCRSVPMSRSRCFDAASKHLRRLAGRTFRLCFFRPSYAGNALPTRIKGAQ